MTLRSGKELDIEISTSGNQPSSPEDSSDRGAEIEEIPKSATTEKFCARGSSETTEPNPSSRITPPAESNGYIRPSFPPMASQKPTPPFPEALKDTRRPTNDKEIFETFSKC